MVAIASDLKPKKTDLLLSLFVLVEKFSLNLEYYQSLFLCSCISWMFLMEKNHVKLIYRISSLWIFFRCFAKAGFTLAFLNLESWRLASARLECVQVVDESQGLV